MLGTQGVLARCQLDGAIDGDIGSYCASTIADVGEGSTLWHGFGRIGSKLANSSSSNTDRFWPFAFGEMTGGGSFGEMNAVSTTRSWNAAGSSDA